MANEMRPAAEATNPKSSPPPPVSEQPGHGRAANFESEGFLPNPLSTTRIGAEITRRREQAAADAAG
jgi:hypothetical protein